jgi:hypothetical protein
MGGSRLLHLLAFLSLRKMLPEKPLQFEQVWGAPDDDGIIDSVNGHPVIRPNSKLLPDLRRQGDLSL